MGSDGETTSGEGAYAVRIAAWPRTRSAWPGSCGVQGNEDQFDFHWRDGTGPYCPLHAHHPASADDIPVLTDCPHRFNGIFETNFEAIGNLYVWIWICRLAELLEVFYCNAVFIRRVTKNNDIEGFGGLV